MSDLRQINTEALPFSSYEEAYDGNHTITIEWRKIGRFPKYEINAMGEVRNRRTRRMVATKQGRRNTLRVMDGGVSTSVSVRHLRNITWSDLEPWR